jgi:hypothetical protein
MVVAGATCILAGVLGWDFLFAKTAFQTAIFSRTQPKDNSSPEGNAHRRDVRRPIFVQEGAIACEDPNDFDALSINAEAFTSLDEGDFFQSCLEWSKQRVRILHYRGALVDVIKADNPGPEDHDAWVQSSSLQN